MAILGKATATGVLSPNNKIAPGGWVVAFDPKDLPRDDDFEVYHGFASGPGGYAFVYLDTTPYDAIENGLFSSYSPHGAAMYVRKGQTITVHWSIATGGAPSVTLYLRQPEVGKL
jgi:hypothetical protein